MPFKEGLFSFKDGEFKISVDSEGAVMITPDHPVSIRISELFETANWAECTDSESTEEEES